MGKKKPTRKSAVRKNRKRIKGPTMAKKWKYGTRKSQQAVADAFKNHKVKSQPGVPVSKSISMQMLNKASKRQQAPPIPVFPSRM